MKNFPYIQLSENHKFLFQERANNQPEPVEAKKEQKGTPKLNDVQNTDALERNATAEQDSTKQEKGVLDSLGDEMEKATSEHGKALKGDVGGAIGDKMNRELGYLKKFGNWVSDTWDSWFGDGEEKKDESVAKK